MNTATKRAFLVVLDSVGVGAAPDAAEYGDEGAATLPHVARAVGGLRLPVMERLGLGCVAGLWPGGIPIEGVRPLPQPAGAYGAMRERSRGKDTTTGHWEMAGLLLEEGFALFPPGPPSFPQELVDAFERETGRRVLGNKAASGTAIIEELGERQMRDGGWIVYTSADSVFQIAAHEEIIPLEELYRACRIARRLCDPYRVGRVIARPFVGQPGAFRRTENRRDFASAPPESTILDRLQAAGIRTVTIGKLDDVFAGRGIDEAVHVENNPEAEAALIERAAKAAGTTFIFANLIDFDMLYGHRRDAAGYARALEQADRTLGEVLGRLGKDDLLLVTADHGNDPTFRGTDHTRELVPLLAWGIGLAGRSLGVRNGFFDVAQTLACFFGIEPMQRGVSILGREGR